MKYYIIFFALIHAPLYGFQSLSDVASYTKVRKEFPDPDSDNWVDPGYTQLYRSEKKGAVHKLLQALRIIKKPNWTYDVFLRQLRSVIEHNENKNKGQFIANITYKKSINLIVWTDLFGAFHSLARDLAWLIKEGIIDDTLHIIKDDYYLVFNGNVISRGPYSLEALTLVINLMLANPNRVIYLRGSVENAKEWMGTGFSQELDIRIPKKSIDKKKLYELVDRFFNTLPLALYVNNIEKLDQVIRISPSDRDNTYIDENQCTTFLMGATQPGLRFYSLGRKDNGKPAVTIIALLQSLDWLHAKQQPYGLDLLEQQYGTTVWGSFSSPIISHEKLYNFTQDSFVVVQALQPIMKSTISLYQQSSKKPAGIELKGSYNIVTGQPADQVTKIPEFLDIGSSMSLISGVPLIGQSLKRGLSLRFNEANAKGGVNGQHIRTFIFNDNYEPYITRKNIDRLVNQGIDTIFMALGAANLAAFIEMGKDAQLLILFPYSGGPQFRRPDLRGVIHFKGSYADEINVLIDFMIKEFAARRFAFFYQSDAYGIPPLEAAHAALKAHGIDTWTDVSYSRGEVDFREQAQKLSLAQPDAIGLIATASAAQELIRQMGVNTLASKKLFGISPLGEEAFRRFIGKTGLSFIFGSPVPNPELSNLPLVKEYRKAMDVHHFPYDVFTLEGYLTASIFLEILSKIEKPVTKEKIISFIESLHNYPFKGLILTFDPKKRNLSVPVWIETSSKEDWREYQPHATISGKESETKEPQATQKDALPATDSASKVRSDSVPIVSPSPIQDKSSERASEKTTGV